MRLLPVACLVAALAHVTVARAAEIINLGTLPDGFYSYANGVSNNGVVTGETDFEFSPTPFRWASSTMTNLGYLPGDTFGAGRGISADGGVIVGITGDTDNQAFRYSGNSMSVLNPLSGDAGAEAYGVSGDGTIAVGMSYLDVPNGDYRAVRWAGATPTALGDLEPGFWSQANGVSFDGTTIVGYAGDANGSDQPFVWTAQNGMTALAHASDFDSGAAEGVSADGSRIVGWSFEQSSGLERAMLWDNGSPVVLGDLNQGASFAYAISSDNFLVVGDMVVGIEQQATLWNAENGQSYDLKALLVQQGATGIGTWDALVSATAVSGDPGSGYNIVGYGLVNGDQRAFLITGFTPVPEPATIVLAVISACTLYRVCRRRSARLQPA